MILCLIWLQMRYKITHENVRAVIYRGSSIFLTFEIHSQITNFYFRLKLIALGLSLEAKSQTKLKLNPFICFLVAQREKNNMFWVYSSQGTYLWRPIVCLQYENSDKPESMMLRVKKSSYFVIFLEIRITILEMTLFLFPWKRAKSRMSL